MVDKMRIAKSNKPSVDKSVDRLNALIEARLQARASKPLTTLANQPASEPTQLKNIIKDPKPIVDTGKPLENNNILDSSDKTPESDIIQILKPSVSNPIQPKVEVVKADMYDEQDKRRLFKEEEERRRLDDERWAELQQAFEDEKKRREAFQKELELMKIEFDLYLKQKYPDIVGEKSIRDGDEAQLKARVDSEKKKNAEIKNSIKANMVNRVSNEKVRKQKENRFVINKPQASEISTFLEEEIVIEQKDKVYRNPEIKPMNDVQKQIKAVEEMELRMGRKIVPHRDIVESEDSDFDSEALTKSTDILIKPNQKSPFENYDDRRESLERLRQSLGGDSNEDDFIVKIDKEDRANTTFRKS